MLRWIRKLPRSPEPVKRWTAFLNNHREAIAAMDFFTVPTLTAGCSTASSLLLMTAGEFSTSM